MATRERKATRSNTDSPTISNSSSRSDTASPVTVRSGTATSTKSKSEATTPVRNPLRSTRAGSVAQSQGGSPPNTTDTTATLAPPEPTESASPVGEEPAEEKTVARSRPTRQTTAPAPAEPTVSTRGIRKPVVASVHNIKRNSLPALGGRAAKMSTRRNSSGKMEAILKACEDEASVVNKPKRGRPVGGTAVERRALLRRKRAVSADEEGKEEEEEKSSSVVAKEVDEEEQEEQATILVDGTEETTTLRLDPDENEEEEEEGAEAEAEEDVEDNYEKKDEVVRRKSVDSVVSKCSEATDSQSMTSSMEVVKQEAQSQEVDGDEEEGDPVEEKGPTTLNKTRGRPGRKRKRAGGNKRSSPVKKTIIDTSATAIVSVTTAVVNENDEGLPTKIKSEVLDEEGEEEEEEGEEQEEVVKDDKVVEDNKASDTIATTEKVNGSAEVVKVTAVESESESKESEENKVCENSENDGQLSIKVEPMDVDQEAAPPTKVAEEESKDSSSVSPAPVEDSTSSLSPVSVQQICGQPAFLENNPGIEKDPKVAAEMVVQQGKKASQGEVKEKDLGVVEKESDKGTDEGKENQNRVNVQETEKDSDDAEAKKCTDDDNEKMVAPASPVAVTVAKATTTAGAVVKEIKKEPESPECSTKKENHLKVLGLLTLRAADQAKHEKARRREILKAFPTPPSINLQLASAGGDSDGGGGANSGEGGKGASKAATGAGSKGNSNNSTNPEYTGTLKTVIKLNRKNGNSAKGGAGGAGGGGGNNGGGRQSLKMTFQKGRGKGGNAQNGGAAGSGGAGGQGKDSRQSASEGEEYYTISKEGNTVGTGVVGAGGGSAQSGVGPAAGEKVEEVEKKTKLTMGQSSSEGQPSRKTNNRSSQQQQQQQINAADCGGSNHSGEDGAGKEEKDLVIPEKAASFSIHPDRLCQDQCFYCGGKFGLFDTPLHIAQIKTAERQKKILDNEEKLTADSCLCDACYRHVDRRANCPSYKKRLSAPASLAVQQQRQLQQQQQEEAMDVDEQQQQQQQQGKTGAGGGADVKRNRGLGPNCSLCRAKMSKNRSFPLNQNVKRLEDMIRGQGIAVQWGITPIVCKLCKFYTEHLTKELRGEAPENNNTFAENYRRRLISFYKTEEAHRKKQQHLHSHQQQTQQARNISNANNNNHSSSSSSSSAAGLVEQSEASRALSRNPAISIRELFPGEDEMGLSVHLPFGQAGLRTPEGWTRSYSLLQYDDATRQLWEDLQRPYGNQSSFIRHLVLLEKYFRNGDLVLSKNASSSAATYSESVQTRLKAFDSTVSLENRTLLSKLSNAPITITQKSTPKVQVQSSQQPLTITPSPPTAMNTSTNSTTVNLPSPPPLVPTTSMATINNTSGTSPTTKVVEAGASLLKKTVNSMPPDLISITTTSTVVTPTTSAQTTNAVVMMAGGAEKTLITGTGAATVSVTNASNSNNSNDSSSTATTPPVTKRTSSPSKARETVVVTLPDTLSTQDRKLVNGKSWRPTLMPVERIELNEDGTRTMFKTADGRLLPSRVQVMSGGKPYHISIYDYNRMCILRREKLVQKAMNSGNGGGSVVNSIGGFNVPKGGMINAVSPPMQDNSNNSQSVSNSNNSSINNAASTSPTASNGRLSGGSGGSSSQRQTIVAPTVQIPSTVLEQNSFVPVTASGYLSITPANGQTNGPNGGGAGGNVPRRNSRSSAGKTTTVAGVGGVSGLSMVNLGSQITATVTSGSSNININSNNNNNNNNNGPTGSMMMSSSGGSLVTVEKEAPKVANHNWMWNPGDLSMDQNMTFPATVSAMTASGVGDNSSSASSAATASLLSRIPKSLTVIPQQKLM